MSNRNDPQNNSQKNPQDRKDQSCTDSVQRGQNNTQNKKRGGEPEDKQEPTSRF